MAVWGGIYALALGFVGRLDEAIEQSASTLAEARRIRPRLSVREARGVVGGRYANALRKIWEL